MRGRRDTFDTETPGLPPLLAHQDLKEENPDLECPEELVRRGEILMTAEETGQDPRGEEEKTAADTERPLEPGAGRGLGVPEEGSDISDQSRVLLFYKSLLMEKK